MEEKKLTDFSFYITSLAMQASICLGITAHPITQKTEKNLPHARLILDTLAMLKEKTAGNLTTEEDSLLDKFLFELNALYAQNPQKEEPL